MTRVWLVIIAILAVAMTEWGTVPSAALSRGQPHNATIRTLPVGPASTSVAVWPALALDRRGAVYFFDGGCGAKPESCSCRVLRQRQGERHPTIIAGGVPGRRARATPAQRLALSSCNSIAAVPDGAVSLFAFDRTHGQYGSKAIFRIDPIRGTYREWQDCVSCTDSRTAGSLRSVSFYGVQSAAFDAAGTAYLANDEHHVLQRLEPGGRVSVIMRPHWRSDYENGALVEMRDCRECANSAVAQNGDVFECPERPAVGPRGLIYYIDEEDNTVRVVDRRGRERVVAGGGTCRIAVLRRCGIRVRATRVRLRDTSGNGPRSLAVDARGNLYIALWSYLLRVAPSGDVDVVAGNGRVLLSAQHRVYPPHVPATRVAITAQAVTVDPHGHVYFLDDTGAVREVVP